MIKHRNRVFYIYTKNDPTIIIPVYNCICLPAYPASNLARELINNNSVLRG